MDDRTVLDTPEEGDYTTKDYKAFYQFGRLAVLVPTGSTWEQMVEAHMNRERFWPNVWFLSDHGNYRLIGVLVLHHN